MNASLKSNAALALSVTTLVLLCLVAADRPPPAVVDEVCARRFTLVGEKGEVLGAWRAGSAGCLSLFEMRGADQKPRLGFGVDLPDERAWLTLMDDGGANVMLEILPDLSASMHVKDRSTGVVTRFPPEKATPKKRR